MSAAATPRRLRALLADRRLGALYGIANQAVISLANLAVGLAVLRFGSKAEFGLYSLGYMGVIVATGFAGGLFAAQLPARIFARAPAARPGFAGALLLGQIGLSLALGLALLALALAAGLASLPGQGGAGAQTMGVALLAAPCAMALDFLRAHRLVLHRPGAALALDLCNALLWALLSLAGWRAGLPVHLAALGGYGIACLASLLLFLPGAGLQFRAMRARDAVAEAWDQGRWALGGVAVTVAQNNAHFYLLAWLAGTGAVAEANAARMLLAPAALITTGVNRTLIPRLAALRAEAGAAIQADASARQALWLVLAAMAAYGLLLASGWQTVSRAVLRDGYTQVGALALAWGLIFAVQAATENLSARLQAEGRFRVLTLANARTALPVVLAVVPMILLAGALGSLLALAAGQAALALLLRQRLRQPRAAAPVRVAVTG